VSASRGAWIVAVVTFAAFAIISFYQGWVGQASCGCLGTKVKVSPWLMFTVDVFAVAGLLLARPDLRPIWENRSRIVRVGATVFGGYLLLLGSLGVFAHYHFGSIDAALAGLRSERLSVYPALVDVGEGAPGESRDALVELSNRTDRPIRIIGGTSDCSCTVLGDLPVTIPPGEARSITVTVYLPNSVGRFNRKAELKIDDQGFGRVGFRLTGRIKKGSQ
jgi:hypothetical protein